PAAVERSVPVTVPSAPVGPVGCVSVLPLPVAWSWTVAPLTRLPFASRAVTVIVEVPRSAARRAGEAGTCGCAAEPALLVPVTGAVWVTASPLIVAELVFTSAAVERSVPVATPLASVGPVGWVSVLPPPLAWRTTVAPLTRLPFASRAVTVIVEVPVPASIVGGAAATVDCAAETPLLVTVTGAVWVTASPLIVAEIVFASATVERSVPVTVPSTPVGPAGCVSVLPLPVAPSATVAPLIGFPFASRA